MAEIETTNDSQNDLTIFTVHGELTADEIFQTVRVFYFENPRRWFCGSYRMLQHHALLPGISPEY